MAETAKMDVSLYYTIELFAFPKKFCTEIKKKKSGNGTFTMQSRITSEPFSCFQDANFSKYGIRDVSASLAELDKVLKCHNNIWTISDKEPDVEERRRRKRWKNENGNL
jgi:hypothetical protein